MSKAPRDQVNLINWDRDWELRVLYHAACSPLLKEFPESLDEQLFGEAGGGTTRGPRQFIVGGILAYVKKRKEAPGMAGMRLIIDKLGAGRSSEIRDAIAQEWERVVAVGQDPPYEQVKAAFPEALYEHVDFQFVMQRAAARRRKEDDKMDWEEYETLIKPIQDRRDKLLTAVNIKKRMRLLKGTELDDSDITWLVDGFFPRGVFCGLSGIDGLGKTLVALEAARAVLTNGLFLDRFMTQRGKVLLIMLDDPQKIIRKRLTALGILDHPDLRIVPELPNPMDPMGSLKDILWFYEKDEWRPDFIVVDSFFNIVPRTKDSDKDVGGLMPLMDLLNQIAEQTSATVLLICHDTKEGRAFAGSHVLKASAKVTMQMTKPGRVRGKEHEYDAAARTLHLLKNKLLGEQEWALRNEGVGKLEFVGTQNEKNETDTRSGIAAFFEQQKKVYDANTRHEIDVHGKYTEEEVVRELSPLPPYIIRRTLYKMKDEGKLEHIHGQRTPTQRNASWYWQRAGTAPMISTRERGVAFFRSKPQ